VVACLTDANAYALRARTSMPFCLPAPRQTIYQCCSGVPWDSSWLCAHP
jgi:hypothetical protein